LIRTSFFAAVGPAIVVGGVVVLGACGSSQKKGEDYTRDEFQGETRDIEIKHETCEPNGHTTKVYKADDPLASNVHAYVTHVFDGSKEICWLGDLNGDGKVDIYTYFDDGGAVRRRESGYTVSNAIDEIALYKSGALDIVMRDTTFDGKLDTWDYYEQNKLARRERDKTGEGRVDEWWTFNPAGGDNATIIQADPRTGKPDPTQRLDINVAFGGPAALAGQPTAAKADAGTDSGDAGKAPALSPMASVVPATDAKYPDAGPGKDAK
jgi:hypothetical protein